MNIPNLPWWLPHALVAAIVVVGGLIVGIPS